MRKNLPAFNSGKIYLLLSHLKKRINKKLTLYIMKKTILLSITVFLSFIGANAQAPTDTTAKQQAAPAEQKPKSGIEKRINLYGAYAFDDHITSSYDNYNYFDGTVKGGLVYGVGIEFVTP